MTDSPNPRAFSFVGGYSGTWSVSSQRTLSGDPLGAASRVEMTPGALHVKPAGSSWMLRGVATNDRYTSTGEKSELVKRQAPIGRPSATRAALILLRKSAAWWGLAQDERRAILEEQSHHIAIGMRYLPAVARRLLHCRDFGTDEPFDFIGFLDYAPNDAAAFDEMLAQLRATREWTFIEREVDLRLEKA
jgi:hypothetical protein